MHPTTDDTNLRWRRLLQPSTYSYDPDRVIDEDLYLDDEIAEMDGLAFFVELTAASPFPVGVLLNDDRNLDSPEGSYREDNVFTWDATTGRFHAPSLFAANFKRYGGDRSLLVAPLRIRVAQGRGDPFVIWNYLLFDRNRNCVDRIDPYSGVEGDLDTVIAGYLAEHSSLIPGLPTIYRPPSETAAEYRSLVAGTIIPVELSVGTQCDIWAFWLLRVRLAFADRSQDDLFEELHTLFTGGDVVVGDLLLNFHADLIDDAHLHTFGSLDFVDTYPTTDDLWRYEPLLAERVRRVSGIGSGRSQLNQLFSAAFRDFIRKDQGAEYGTIYAGYQHIDPLFVPKPQESGGWIDPVDFTSETTTLLMEGQILFGFVQAAPYVYTRKGEVEVIGFDYDLANRLLEIIRERYAQFCPKGLVASWTDMTSHIDPDNHDAESAKLNALYQGLEDGLYHIAMSGQMVMPPDHLTEGVDPEWTTPTALIFTGITYTGRDDKTLKLKQALENMKEKTRDEFIGTVVKVIGTSDLILTFFSVINPGPSPGSAQNLVSDINAKVDPKATGGAAWITGAVAQSDQAMAGRYHFTVGDGIQSARQVADYEAAGKTYPGLYLNMSAVDKPSIYYDPAVRSATLLPIAAFTLKDSS